MGKIKTFNNIFLKQQNKAKKCILHTLWQYGTKMPFKMKGHTCTNPKANCLTYQFLPNKALQPNFR